MKAVARQRSKKFLESHGLHVDVSELQTMLKFAVLQLQESLYPSDPHTDFTKVEADALSKGGLDLRPRTQGEKSALAQTTARYAALLETSLSTAEAAQRLAVEPSRIRQRLAQRTLYGIRAPQGWRLPAFQFLVDGLLPSVGEVLAQIRADLHPVAVHNFFTQPSPDLYVEELGRDLSPREWLQAGYTVQAVADLASRIE